MKEQTDSKTPKIRFKGHSEAWRTASVSSLLAERNVQAPKSEQYPLMAFIAGQGVAPKGKRYNREFLVSDELNKKYKQTELGDFIYSSNNLETGSIGTNNYGSASISPVYSIFSPTLEGDSSFIGQLLCKKAFINEMVKWRQGVVYGQWRIHESDFLKIKAIFPTVDEQTQIGEYFRELDRLIGLHQRKHDKLVTLKKAMLQKMFPLPGATIPEIRFKGFSGNWVEKRLGELSSLITKGTTPLVKSGRGLVNFVKIENINKLTGEITITSKISETEHLSYLKRSQLKTGDILFSIAGTLGRVAVVHENLLPANTNQALAIIRLAGGDVGYITTYLKGRAVDDFVKKNPTVGAQPNLSLEQVGTLEVLLPPEREQQKIGTYFHTLDVLISKHAIQLQKLKQIKSACLEKMFV